MPREIYFNDAPPVERVEVAEAPTRPDSGVKYCTVERTESLFNSCDELLGVAVAQVMGEGHYSARHVSGGISQFRGGLGTAAIGERHVCSAAGELENAGPSDTPRPAGDQHGPRVLNDGRSVRNCHAVIQPSIRQKGLSRRRLSLLILAP